jgi:DNA-directed RNA polymerase subunit RPC12/RpoP
MNATKTAMARCCGFCNAPADVTLETESDREYTCPKCGAKERITKARKNADGSFTPGWYWGWKHPDGRKLRVATVEEMQRGKFGWQPA